VRGFGHFAPRVGCLSGTSEPSEAVDEAAQVLAELCRIPSAGNVGVIPDRDLRENPGQLRGSQPPVLALRCGEGIDERQAKAFQRANVDQVPNLGTSEKSAQLVRENLLGRVHSHRAVRRLLGLNLLGVLDHEIDDDRIVVS